MNAPYYNGAPGERLNDPGGRREHVPEPAQDYCAKCKLPIDVGAISIAGKVYCQKHGRLHESRMVEDTIEQSRRLRKPVSA